jgi:hypothetical protein
MWQLRCWLRARSHEDGGSATARAHSSVIQGRLEKKTGTPFLFAACEPAHQVPVFQFRHSGLQGGTLEVSIRPASPNRLDTPSLRA